MKQTAKKGLNKVLNMTLLIISWSHSISLYAAPFQELIDLKDLSYSDTVVGSISLSSVIELSFLAEVNCYQPPHTDFQVNPYKNKEFYFDKDRYLVSIEDAEKEAEILFSATGFFDSSLHKYEIVEPVISVQTAMLNLSEDQRYLLGKSLLTMISHLIYQQQSDDQRCWINNVDVRFFQKFNLQNL